MEDKSVSATPTHFLGKSSSYATETANILLQLYMQIQD